MRWWGKSLVSITIIFTALAIISFFTCLSQVLFASIAVVLWAILILSHVAITHRTQIYLDNFIGDGNHLLSIITAESWDAIDKYDLQMDEWATNVRKLLRIIGFENEWMSNSGLDNKEDENTGNEIKDNLAIKRNYMRNRIIRLQEIKAKLGD